MCKKLLLFTAAIVLLLSFTGITSAASLTAHWKFDGDPNDYVGNNNLTMTGDPVYVDGMLGQAIQFDSNDYGSAPSDASMSFGAGSFSVALWMKKAVTVSSGERVLMCGDADRYAITRYSGFPLGQLWFLIDDDATNDKLWVTSGTASFSTGEWVHCVCIRDATAERLYIYKDGVQVGSANGHNKDIDSPDPMKIGDDNRDYCTLDDIRLYDYILTQTDINNLAFPFAHAPAPSDDEIDVVSSSDLDWEPGTLSDDFDVYFGTDFDDVNDANTTVQLSVYQGRTVNSDYTLSTLFADKDYYWRIDSNDVDSATLHKGSIWHFTTASIESSAPIPFDGAKYVHKDDNLLWTGGEGATSHDVYLGTNWDDVNDANTTTYPGVIYTSETGTSHDPTMVVDTEYFWRVDEVSGASTFKGEVWTFSTAQAADPNLVAHYKFDELGSHAYDASGNGNVGTFEGNPTLDTSGRRNSAIVLDGTGDHILVDDGNGVEFGADAFSVAFWMKTVVGTGTLDQVFNSGTSGGEYGGASGKRYELEMRNSGKDFIFFIDDGSTKITLNTNSNLIDDYAWHHVVAMRTAGVLALFIDGAWKQSADTATCGNIDSPGEPLFIGAEQASGNKGDAFRFFEGSFDDMRFYDYRIPDIKITELALVDFAHAWNPDPSNGEGNIRQNPVLSWIAGSDPYDEVVAAKHDVYFGTDYNDVNDATIIGSEYMGRITGTSWDPNSDGGLSDFDLNKQYYWRIDEVNDTPGVFAKGYVWKFKTADFVIVDDMELYGSPDPNEVWNDSTIAPTATSGSVVSLVKTVVNGGSKSLKYDYDNDSTTWYPYHFVPCYSEIEASTTGPNSLDCGTDWTREASKALTLYFYGDPNNDVIGDANAMYIVIEDGDGSDANAIIKYGDYNTDDEDVNDLKEESWHEWNISLDDFNTPNDVNLANIAKVYIGFGRRGEPNNNYVDSFGRRGGDGVVYFDDIRLNRSRCVAIYNSDTDLNGDCDIDYDDIALLQDDWLDVNTVVINPGSANLVAYYEFEDDADNSLGGTPDQNGVKYGNSTYTTGKIGGKALGFDPSDANDYVIVDDANGTIAAEFSTGSFSVALWMKTELSVKDGHLLCNGTDGTDTWGTIDPCEQSGKYYRLFYPASDALQFKIDDDVDVGEATIVSSLVTTGEWVHLAAVRDTSAGKVQLYVDGMLEGVGGATDVNSIASPDEPLVFGARAKDVDNGTGLYTCEGFYTGELDDVRIYDKALTVNEVIYIASEGASTTPDDMKYDTDLNLDNFVDLKDYAVLADAWLDDYRWP